MNRLWLGPAGEYHSIPQSDRRYSHILRVLKKGAGDFLEAGCQDGSIGKALIESVGLDALTLRFEVSGKALPPLPVRMIMGFPRPIQAGRILKDMTSLGAASIWFVLSELGEKSYAESKFFRNREYEQYLIEGAEQCGNPLLPEVRTFWSLESSLDALDRAQDGRAGAVAGRRVCFHPDPELPSLTGISGLELPLTLALGSERGWTPDEIEAFTGRGFVLCSLGSRILKTETAAVASLAIALARLGSI